MTKDDHGTGVRRREGTVGPDGADAAPERVVVASRTKDSTWVGVVAGPCAVESRDESSEIWVSRIAEGWEARDEEEGVRSTSSRGPGSTSRLAFVDPETLADQARVLLRVARSVLRPHRDELFVSLTAAWVRQPAARLIRTAGLSLGSDADLPRWTRTAPLANRGASWPAGFLEACCRSIDRCTASPPGTGGTRLVPDLPLVLDVFAAADWLRIEAQARWRFGFPSGQQVAPRSLDLDAADLLEDPAGAGATPLIRNGRWQVHPANRGKSGENEPLLGASSWPGLRVAPAGDRDDAPWPASATIIDRLLRWPDGRWIGFGEVRRSESDRRIIGPIELQAGVLALERWRGWIGAAVPDASGWPVLVPAAEFAPPSWTGDAQP